MQTDTNFSNSFMAFTSRHTTIFKVNSLCLALLLFSLFIGACQKDGPGSSAENLSFKANGESYSTATGTALIQKFQALGESIEIVNIAGLFGLNSSIYLQLYNPSLPSFTTGQYEFTGDDEISDSDPYAALIFSYQANPETEFIYSSEEWSEGRLSLQLTHADFVIGGRVKGTFSGTVINGDGDKFEITEGKFDVLVSQ